MEERQEIEQRPLGAAHSAHDHSFLVMTNDRLPTSLLNHACTATYLGQKDIAGVSIHGGHDEDPAPAVWHPKPYNELKQFARKL